MAKRVGALSMLKNGCVVVAKSIPIMLPIVIANGLMYGWLDHKLGETITVMQASLKPHNGLVKGLGLQALY